MVAQCTLGQELIAQFKRLVLSSIRYSLQLTPKSFVLWRLTFKPKATSKHLMSLSRFKSFSLEKVDKRMVS